MSTQVVNGRTLQTYPIFEGSQVLTSEQLNTLFEYLDQQTRYSRSKLIGMGVVCGLQVRRTGTQGQEVALSQGLGITSDGYMIRMPECTMKYYRPYNLPTAVVYEPFGDFDENLVFEQNVVLHELLANQPEEGEFLPIDSGFLDDKYFVLFLECFDSDPRGCLGKNCEDLGKNRTFTLRKIAVNETDLQKILSNEDDINAGAIPNPYHTTSGLPHFVMPKPLFVSGEDANCTSYNELFNEYERVLFNSDDPSSILNQVFGGHQATGQLYETYQRFEPMLAPVYDHHNPLADNPQFDNVKQAIRNLLQGEGSSPAVQLVYEYIGLLVQAYTEFVMHAEKLVSACCPSKFFPLHLLLGKIVHDDDKETDEIDILGESLYRHKFVSTQIFNSQNELRERVISLHKRLILMVLSFDEGQLQDNTLRITPSGGPELGDASIPGYLNIQHQAQHPGVRSTSLEKEWNFDSTITGIHSSSVLSYGKNLMAANNLDPTPSNFTTAPLKFNAPQAYRVEGVIGKDVSDAVDQEDQLRRAFNLPFNVLPVRLEGHEQIAVEQRFWQDMQEDYRLVRSAFFAICNNLIASFSEFESASVTWNYNGPVYTADIEALIDEIRGQVVGGEIVSTGLIADAESHMQTLLEVLPVLILHLYEGNAESEDPVLFGDVEENYKQLQLLVREIDLVLQHAVNLLVVERGHVLPPLVLDLWTTKLHELHEGLRHFLEDESFYQIFNLYHRFVQRYEYLQQQHYTIFCNLIDRHPGIGHLPVKSGETHILVHETVTDDELEYDNIVAHFTLPYLIDSANEPIPLTEDLLRMPLPPYARGEGLLVYTGQSVQFDAIANDIDAQAGQLIITRKGHFDQNGEFVPDESQEGGSIQFEEQGEEGEIIIRRFDSLPSLDMPTFETRAPRFALIDSANIQPVFPQITRSIAGRGGAQTVIIYEPAEAFEGHDAFEYMISPVQDGGDDTSEVGDKAYVALYVVPPYTLHIQAIDDLSATSNRQSVFIDVLSNDIAYGGQTTLELPAASDAGATIIKTEDNRVLYVPLPGYEGVDTFNYEIVRSRGESGEERSEATVDVVVFCCDHCETEIICGPDPLQLDPYQNRDERRGQLALLDQGNPVQSMETQYANIEIVTTDPDEGGNSSEFIQYVPKEPFTGRESFDYLITYDDSTIVRGCQQIISIPCEPNIGFEKGWQDTASYFYLEDVGQVGFEISKNPDHGQAALGNDEQGPFVRYIPEVGFTGWDQIEVIINLPLGTSKETIYCYIDGDEQITVESARPGTSLQFSVLNNPQQTVAFIGEGIEDYQNAWNSDKGGVITSTGQNIDYQSANAFDGVDTFPYVVLENNRVIRRGRFFVHVQEESSGQLPRVSVHYTSRNVGLQMDVYDPDEQFDLEILRPGQHGKTNVIDLNGRNVIDYQPNADYIGQDSVDYVLSNDETKEFGTAFIIVDADDRISVYSTFQNQPVSFELFSPVTALGDFEVQGQDGPGQLNWEPGSTKFEFLPFDDFTGLVKIRYMVRVDNSVQYGTLYIMVICDCGKATEPQIATVSGTVTSNEGPVISGALVSTGIGEAVTNNSGFYQVAVMPGENITYSAVGFFSRTLQAPAGTGQLNVQLTRIRIGLTEGGLPGGGVALSEPVGGVVTPLSGTVSSATEGGTISNLTIGTVSTRNTGSTTDSGAFEIEMSNEDLLEVSAPGFVPKVVAPTSDLNAIKLQPAEFAELNGKLVNRTTGSGIAKTLIELKGRGVETTTNARGNFTFQDVKAADIFVIHLGDVPIEIPLAEVPGILEIVDGVVTIFVDKP